MILSQNEMLRYKIYDIICCICKIKEAEFSPDLLINYGKYEQFSECADDLTFDDIPEALGLCSNALPFENNIYFRD